MRVMLAMSGGVDSSVAGVLLAEAGYEVVGVTMRLWGGESDTGCCSVSDVDDARRVAQQLGIDHVVFNFGDEFDRTVVQPYVDAHRAGRTPNPCIECNRHVKFDRLAERAALLGFDAVATGHHARIRRRTSGQWQLCRGVDRAKDQSYVVHMLDQEKLARTMFPVGELTKEQVRVRARELGLRTASKPDSQDVCFITSTGGRETFLGDRIPVRRATVVDTEGRELGQVPAIELITIGQRRGLGLPGGGPKRYVIATDWSRSQVMVGTAEELLDAEVEIGAFSWVGDESSPTRPVLVQCSAHGTPRPAQVVDIRPDPVRSADRTGPRAQVRLRWQDPQPRIAPGQSVVLYDPDDRYVLGGGLAQHSTPVVPRRINPPADLVPSPR